MTEAERIAWFDGEFVAESEVRIPLRDAGFFLGYAVFDTLRTFAHRLYRLDDHIERLWRSLEYVDIDPRMSRAELAGITEEVVARNVPRLDPDDDYWVTQRVTLGEPAGSGWRSRVIVECKRLPFAERAAGYRDGIDLRIAALRRTPPEALSPRAKTHNYINLVLADRRVKEQHPGAWSLTLDIHGNLCEGTGSNVFLVRDGELLTPREQYVLPGVSRDVVIELATRLGIACRETDLDLYDAFGADEIFLTSTSLCLCPVGLFEGRGVGAGTIPGPITQRLTAAWIDELDGFDFVAQYLRRLESPSA